ncbi:Major intrinsic protein [Akanthomyces lecanii RCEF 1005]|uniref:Major intrinsic protein n=1 Tax=Akanthomyces lecanii RCEF 1005 TaxID=1081108 RepID=A0A167N6Z2_CORDF|nr:Major intrinsic protein [Akanthomyces lecanii RCEF 1005]
MLNPAITLGLVLVGNISLWRSLLVVLAQLAAGIAAAAVARGLTPGPLVVANKLGSGTSLMQGLLIEMFLTAQIVLTIYLLAVEKHAATFLAPMGIGIAVFVAHICGTNLTGTEINPARSFGPAVVAGFVSYHWIYWLGPLLSVLLAFSVYRLLKWLDYTTLNPGQNADAVEEGNGR